MNDKITLSREQWELLRLYIIWTETYRKSEVEVWRSASHNYPDCEPIRKQYDRWQEMDLGLEKLLNTIE